MFKRIVQASNVKNGTFFQTIRQISTEKPPTSSTSAFNQNLSVSGSGHNIKQAQMFKFGSGLLLLFTGVTGASFYLLHSYCQKQTDSKMCEKIKEYIFSK